MPHTACGPPDTWRMTPSEWSGRDKQHPAYK